MPISESLVRDSIGRAVSDVCSRMLGKAPILRHGFRLVPPSPGEAVPPTVVGAAGITGSVNGFIHLYFDLDFANHCTRRLLGLLDGAVVPDSSVNDAVGELTNMTVGAFKRALSAAGFSCRLTTSSILRGGSFNIEPITFADRHVFRFEMDGGGLTTDILIETALVSRESPFP